jgi:hypothetical protein
VRRSAARRPQRRHRRFETNVVFLALAVIAILTVIVISAWKASGGKSPAAPPVKKTPTVVHRPKVKPPLLEVTAKRGQTHLIVHKGSATGNVVFDGTISKGDPPRAINGTRLWVQIDTPENLTIRIAGHLVRVPGAQPRVGIVTKTGWRAT